MPTKYEFRFQNTVAQLLSVKLESSDEYKLQNSSKIQVTNTRYPNIKHSRDYANFSPQRLAIHQQTEVKNH